MKSGAILLLAAVATSAQASLPDQDAKVLANCLSDPANASTAGQTDCEATAERAYDARMNRAYSALMKRLPTGAGNRLRRAQRAWLAFRDSESSARSALYATRQGTIYVPMAAAQATAITRDRTIQLEGYLRVLAITP